MWTSNFSWAKLWRQFFGRRQRSNAESLARPEQPAFLRSRGGDQCSDQRFQRRIWRIANIRVNTKRGGSGYHGSIFYNNKNSALAPGPWPILPANENLRDSIPSKYPNPYFNFTDRRRITGPGPIPGLKKTWFFAAYERNWEVSPIHVSADQICLTPVFTRAIFRWWTSTVSLALGFVDSTQAPLMDLTPEELATDIV